MIGKRDTKLVVVNYDGKSFIYGYWPSEHQFPYTDSEDNTMTCAKDVIDVCVREANNQTSNKPIMSKFDRFEFSMAEYGFMRQEEEIKMNIVIKD